MRGNAVHVRYENRWWVVQSPFSNLFLMRIKKDIPYQHRKWDRLYKEWRIHSSHTLTLRMILQDVYGHVWEPADKLWQRDSYLDSQGRPIEEVRLMHVTHLGRCQQRGQGQSIAMGKVDGRWSAMFEEKVLRAWFDRPTRPNQERYLPRPSEANTLYTVLGLTVKATTQEIRKAHRRLVRTWHPDRTDDSDAAEEFRIVQSAYETLKHSNTKAKYDVGLALEAQLKAHEDKKPPQAYKAPKSSGTFEVRGIEEQGVFIVLEILSLEPLPTNMRPHVKGTKLVL